MRKFLPFMMAMLFVGGAWAQQSLGEIARLNRAKKKPKSTIQFNDDNMPRTLTSNPDDDTPKATGKPAASAGKNAEKKTADSGKASSDKLNDDIKAQKDKITLLKRELDVAEREQRLRAAAFYGDAGTRLRDQAKFAKDSRDKQAEIDGKKQALAAAQQKLSDLEEQARKAGVHSTD